MPDYGKLKMAEQYALASAGYTYTLKLQFNKARGDLVEYLKKCAPIAYIRGQRQDRVSAWWLEGLSVECSGCGC